MVDEAVDVLLGRHRRVAVEFSQDDETVGHHRRVAVGDEHLAQIVENLRLGEGVGGEVVDFEDAEGGRLARVRVAVLQAELDGANLRRTI